MRTQRLQIQTRVKSLMHKRTLFLLDEMLTRVAASRALDSRIQRTRGVAYGMLTTAAFSRTSPPNHSLRSMELTISSSSKVFLSRTRSSQVITVRKQPVSKCFRQSCRASRPSPYHHVSSCTSEQHCYCEFSTF